MKSINAKLQAYLSCMTSFEPTLAPGMLPLSYDNRLLGGKAR